MISEKAEIGTQRQRLTMRGRERELRLSIAGVEQQRLPAAGVTIAVAHDRIRDKNKDKNKARMVTGYCWDWTKK